MPRNKKTAAIRQYRKLCEDYYTLRHEYKNVQNLRTYHYAVYRRLSRYEKRLKKFETSPDISLLVQREIQDEVKRSVEELSSDEEDTEIAVWAESAPQPQCAEYLTQKDPSLYCDNCLRMQSEHLVSEYGNTFRLQFTERSAGDLRGFQEFKFAPRGDERNPFYLCQECDRFLVTEKKATVAKSAKNTWPSFILATLINEDVISIYGNKVWKLIPSQWRYWWVETLPLVCERYDNVSIDSPYAVTVDKSFELVEWKTKINSQLLPEIEFACNKYMMPTILCPWGCNEFIFRTGFVSIDIVFQRFLNKVALTMIHNIDTMKYITYCRDDYIRGNNGYDCLLLNKEWTVKPSFCLRRNFGVQVMTCQDHDKGCPRCMIHPPRQPNHILSSRYSDQLCHAVIKPRTISMSKAQKYSNTYQMHEQRGNFNGIDTCSLTQYRNFKLLSFLLQENELRSLKGRADINALLTQLVKEKVLSPEIAANYRKMAEEATLNIDYLSQGATYVPIDVAVDMGIEKDRVVIWDENGNNQEYHIKPAFPKFVYPLQSCQKYGVHPHIIPTFRSVGRDATNTSMLWLLSGLLIRVQEIWELTHNMPLRQSKWNGWILAYLAKKTFHHYNARARMQDPFHISYMSSINKLVNKLESILNNGSFSVVFSETPGIHVMSDFNLTTDFDSSVHQCIIIEHQSTEIYSEFTEQATFDGTEYELRVIACICQDTDSATKYNGTFISRHGGCHSGWWLQNRTKKVMQIPFQIDKLPSVVPEDATVTAVYVKNTDTSLKKYGYDILKFIGGQTHAICHNHDHPLIPVPDRIATCVNCDRKEHFRCPELGCCVCLCKKCYDKLDDNTINRIKGGEQDGGSVDDRSEVSDEDGNSVSSSTNNSSTDEESENGSNNDGGHFYEVDSDSESGKSTDYLQEVKGDVLNSDDLEDFVTKGATDYGYDSDDSYKEDNDGGALGDFDITTDAGEIPFEIEEEVDLTQTRGMRISGHVVMNFVGSLLTRKRHTLKSSSLHKYFLQRLVSTSIGNSVSLLYPEAMLFPSIFWSMKEKSLVGAIPASLLNDNTARHGFASLPQHVRSRLTASSYQTSTNNRYTAWSYDILTNLATNNHDTRMVVSKGLTASSDESGGLSLRGGNKESPLLDSIDSKQMIKNLMASQRYYPFDFFLSFTCNMKLHFGTKPIKAWIDGIEWCKNFYMFDKLTEAEKVEITHSLSQAASSLLLRAWNESCRIFLDYLKLSPHSPFKAVDAFFARHEFQSSKGNLPHIHAMLKVKWQTLNEEEKHFVKDLVRADVFEIVKPHEEQRYYDESIIKDNQELKERQFRSMEILRHRCTPRCQVMVKPGVTKCRKPNNLLLNPPPYNIKDKYVQLANDYSIPTLKRLERVGIIEPLQYDHVNDYMKPFKSRLPYFHPSRHVPAVNWNDIFNISPVEGYTFMICQSMQNIQIITNTGGCNKYCIKYVGKIDEQNCVIVYSDGHKNGVLITKAQFLHNTKLSASKTNEEKLLNSKREASHQRGRAVAETEMLHNMLKYSEVSTDMVFVDIATTPLELRPSVKVAIRTHRDKNNDTNITTEENNTPADGAEIGNECNNARNELSLVNYRQFTSSQLLILSEEKKQKIKVYDKISEFSIRPPELLSCFDMVGSYYRWFKIIPKKMPKGDVLKLIDSDLKKSAWIDGQSRKVLLRAKALPEVLVWLNNVITNDDDFNDDSEKKDIYQLFMDINDALSNPENDETFVEFIHNHLLFEETLKLPIPVYSYIRPSMPHQFILHILLSLGRFQTEIDLHQHTSLRNTFRYAKLIGLNNDEESLRQYSDKLFVRFIEEQLIFFPNSRQIIDTWIYSSGELFDDVIIEGTIPITEMPAVQLTSILKAVDEKSVALRTKIKEEVISSAFKELGGSLERCHIPSKEAFLNASKQYPLQWDALDSLQQSDTQPDESFKEQSFAIKKCTETINEYANINRTHMVKSCGIRGFAGCGKSWCMQYCILHAYSKGLLAIPTAMMSRRSVFLGTKHLDWLFSLPYEKNFSPYKTAESAIARLLQEPEKENILRCLDILFIDEVGQVSAELLSTYDMILRRVRNTQIVFGGVLIIGTLDHTQLLPVSGRPLLLSSLIITCFVMVNLKISVRCVDDDNFMRLQELLRMNYLKYTPQDFVELRHLLSIVPTFVSDWNSPEIESSTYRLYGKKKPAIQATRDYINNVRRIFDAPNLLEKRAVDVEKIRNSHRDWIPAQTTTSEILSRKVKEPETLLFFKHAIYEFTHNLDGHYSQSQMAILYDLPDVEALQANRKVEVLAAPPGLHDFEIDPVLSKEDYIEMGFYVVKVGIAPMRTQRINNFLQAQRKQYALKHRVTATIHAAMGDTLSKVAMQIVGVGFELWDKGQVVVALSRTRLGKDVIFVGNKEETINLIVRLCKTHNQWTDYMENILDLITIDEDNHNERTTPSLTTESYPFRICDIPLPQCKSGFVYFLISVKTRNFTYIGECKCIVSRLRNHNSGHGSSSTTPAHNRPYAILGYIAGFNGTDKSFRKYIEDTWKNKRDYLRSQGIEDPRRWFQIGAAVIDELDDDLYKEKKKELRIIELFKE